MVFRQDGYTFRIYPNDHPPAHVHVQHAGAEARVTLAPIEVKTNTGFNPRELSRIVEIIEQRQAELLEVWRLYHE
jgi:hypothetical protein